MTSPVFTEDFHPTPLKWVGGLTHDRTAQTALAMWRRAVPSKPCCISRCNFPGAVLQHLKTGFESAPPFCHAPEPPHLCVRIPTRDPRLHRQICCKITGHRRELLQGGKSYAPSLTEWLPQKTQVISRGECYGHGGQTTVAFRIRRCRTHRPLPDIQAPQTHPDPLPKTYLDKYGKREEHNTW